MHARAQCQPETPPKRPYSLAISRVYPYLQACEVLRVRRVLTCLLVACLASTLVAQNRTMPIGDVRPGMVGVGRTVFEGDRLDEFKVHILGGLRTVIGPSRNLILARREGGPLANTG